MKILFISTKNKKYQGDFLELTILHGLKKILGDDCFDLPRKKVLYHDFSEVKKDDLHGRGFTLLHEAVPDIKNRNIELKDKEFDFVLYGCGHAYGEEVFLEKYDSLSKFGSWVLDGHDLYGSASIKKIYKGEEIIANQFEKSFKRELIFRQKNVYPTGFGVPEKVIKPLDFTKKTKLFQDTYPKDAFFEKPTDLGGSKSHHLFKTEEEYYKDLSESWFGLSCKKGGWDGLRHYEIISAGTLLLFKDYKNKPNHCSPGDLPAISYSSKKELIEIMNKLVVNNKPTEEYMKLLRAQREWLYRFGTTTSRAASILRVLSSNMLPSIK